MPKHRLMQSICPHPLLLIGQPLYAMSEWQVDLTTHTKEADLIRLESSDQVNGAQTCTATPKPALVHGAHMSFIFPIAMWLTQLAHSCKYKWVGFLLPKPEHVLRWARLSSYSALKCTGNSIKSKLWPRQHLVSGPTFSRSWQTLTQFASKCWCSVLWYSTWSMMLTI